MFKIFRKAEKGFLFCVLVAAGCVCLAGEREADSSKFHPVTGQLDKTRYITLDEIRPGMEAYCLTVYKGTKIEKFNLEVLDVVRNIAPGKNAIFVQGTDERFIHTGPVAGCSGSPVYINGRLAGALAFGWAYSKDPLYGVTPIEEMLQVGENNAPRQNAEQTGFSFDFSRPIDFAEFNRQMAVSQFSKDSNLKGATALPCPLITSGLPSQVCERLNDLVKPFGLLAVPGIAGGVDTNSNEKVQLVAGACLVVPLVTGDITMEAVGAVTEIVGDRVYGFGHSFLGYGAIDLPMATGKIHTIVSSTYSSFKLASSLEIVGALTTDESAAVRGQIGAKAKMIPLTIKVSRYNDAQKRTYNCELANNRRLTPKMAGIAMIGAVLMLGDLPPEHTIEYKVTVGMENAEPVFFENVSTNVDLADIINESVGVLAILMNNPYKEVDIKSVDFDIRITPKNITSHIWSVNLSDSKVKAGESIDVSVVMEAVLAEKKEYRYRLKIPSELAAGKYDLIICGSAGYEQFLKNAMPYKFVAQNFPTMIDALNNILRFRRDKLYCLLVLPPAGISLEKSELPDLPATKAMVLLDSKRPLKVQLYPHWVENSLVTGTITADKNVVNIIVEK